MSLRFFFHNVNNQDEEDESAGTHVNMERKKKVGEINKVGS